MLVGSLNFDLIIAIPMGHSDNIMFGGCLMMTSYMEMLVDLVLLDLYDFDVILEMDWLVSFYVLINYFGKRVISIFLVNNKFSFKGKHVVRPLCMILAL